MSDKQIGDGRAGCLRVLGVDPAAAGPTGYGIVESDGRTFQVVHYGALRVPARRQKLSAGAVLQDVHQLLCELIKEFQPEVIAVESVFTALNMRTALRLAEVRGVVLLAAEQHGLEIHSYSPREVKACVAGYGNADKKQMQIMVRALLSMKEIPEPSDAADALAVALCHMQGERYERRFGVAQAMAQGMAQGQNSQRSAPRPASTSATTRGATGRATSGPGAGIQSNR
jgi:crossover junction endodeoxyribonuclease RuvC